MTHPRPTLIDAYFGEYGGQYVPEVLYPSLDQLEKAYVDALNDPEFLRELDELRRNYLGRPTPITDNYSSTSRNSSSKGN